MKKIEEKVNEKKEYFTNKIEKILKQIENLYNEIEECADKFEEENENNDNEETRIDDCEFPFLVDGFYGALNEIEMCQSNLNNAMWELQDISTEDVFDDDDYEVGEY